ncbi:hypothetical protein CHARACLAT_011600 [Characodon lateralis]|uniref:Secreted protein n=1 Tax=Characodon lateralis TaxID=208331 RepID=A0ABU7CMV6_9TELE|nr:hypothetical protein [Characodon lateralis]
MLLVFVSSETVSMLWAVMTARCTSVLLKPMTLRRMSGPRWPRCAWAGQVPVWWPSGCDNSNTNDQDDRLSAQNVAQRQNSLHPLMLKRLRVKQAAFSEEGDGDSWALCRFSSDILMHTSQSVSRDRLGQTNLRILITLSEKYRTSVLGVNFSVNILTCVVETYTPASWFVSAYKEVRQRKQDRQDFPYKI